jgi:hypothetical protein
VLSAFALVIALAFVAFAVDVAYLAYTKAQLQNVADAAALAACLELKDGLGLRPTLKPPAVVVNGRSAAETVAALHSAGPRSSVSLGSSANVTFGTGTFRPGQGWSLISGGSPFNTVEVVTGFDGQAMDRLPLFFAPVLGVRHAEIRAQATAGMMPASGFALPPGDPRTVPVLPFTFDLPSWLVVESGVGQDAWGYDPVTRKPVPGGDLIPEFNLYPDWTRPRPSGNLGIVSLGAPQTDTPTVRRWILNGPNGNDLAYFGGQIGNQQCPLELSGVPGLRATLEAELKQILGQTRVIPIFTAYAGSGSQATYSIERFVGVRILDVVLTGPGKHLTVQPAAVVHSTATPGRGNNGDIFRSPQLIK